MSEYLIQSETLTALGNKIRSVTGGSEQMTPAQMISALDNITVGLSGEKDRIEGYITDDKTAERVIEISPPAITDVSDIPQFFNHYKIISLPLVTSILDNCFIGPYLESIDLPACTYIGAYAFSENADLALINIPACQSVGNNGFADCVSLASMNLPACTDLHSCAFQNCSALEVIYLNTACDLDDYVFDGVLDPDNKTFKIHFTGTSLPSSYGSYDGQKLFGDLSDPGGCGSGSGSEPGEQTTSDQPIPGLEIYVPANMLDEFKTSWCNGLYANNIFAEPTVDA